MREKSASGADSFSSFHARDWWAVLRCTAKQVRYDDVAILAAGVAFYFMLSIFPALIALVTLYGLVADPAIVQEQVASLSGVVPPAALTLIRDRLESLVSAGRGALGVGLAVSLVLAVWSASSGTKALIRAVSLAYEQEEGRGWLRLRLIALAWTLGIVLLMAIGLFVAAGLPMVLGAVGLSQQAETLIAWARWPVLFAGVVLALSLLYRRGPDQRGTAVRRATLGAVVAALVWVLASAALSFYVSQFGNYEETYGALAGVIITLLWLYVGSFAILLGAELNSEADAHHVDGPARDPESLRGHRGERAHA